MNIAIKSIGCRLNQSEIQSVITQLKEDGHHIVPLEEADCIIINSCAVTVTSERKTRKLIFQSQRILTDNKLILVTGCMSPSIEREGNVFYIPNDYKYMIPDIIHDPETFETLTDCSPGRFNFPIPEKSTTTRINLKIQDGCDNLCSYCIVPYVRGMPQSKRAKAVLDEFKKLLDAGYKEIVLSGVMIGQYRDNDYDLTDLMEKLLTVEGNYRIHLSSLSPHYVSPKMIALLRSDKMVKHLHLSLQSGSNTILKEMNRPYTREAYIKLIETIKKDIPLINVTTDIIVGFPGESEKDFSDTLNIVERVFFSHVHTFRFSPRPGTKAFDFSNNITEKVKRERSESIITLYNKQKIEYYKLFNNKESTFLSERFRNGVTGGFNEYYIPIKVYKKLKRNEFFNITTVLDEDEMVLVDQNYSSQKGVAT